MDPNKSFANGNGPSPNTQPGAAEDGLTIELIPPEHWWLRA